MLDDFDIRSASNRYLPCPACGGTVGIMGLVGRGPLALLAVECQCDFRGPEFARDANDILAADRAAFDAWNALPRKPS
jgi:hypothetical protein